ncbi:MAG: DUF2891 family protein [Nitrospirae bacterium]|nr:DUF2891 family protein [Nitrospirota bacterium]
MMSWDIFCQSRVEYLRALAAVVEQGVTRKDTTYPTFCGCIDWHSSVHGVWALLTASRLTGESRWAEVADSVLHAEGLAAEMTSLEKGELDHELPYGYAWFLKLAQEREQQWGQADVRTLATILAERLAVWIGSLSSEAILQHARNRKYGNLSWAVLNLWEWSQWTADSALAEKLEAWTTHHLLPLDQELPPSYDSETDEFFAASLQRTRSLLAILPSHIMQAWVKTFYENELPMQPLQDAPTPHSAGLNFSRCWGLWDMYRQSGDVRYRDMYVNHLVTQMELPQYWRNDYQKYCHWVPQFGIYAIALSMVEGASV